MTQHEEPAVERDVDRLLGEHPPGLQAIERALRATIRSAFPGAVEQVDFANKLIAFGRSMKIRGLLFAIIAHKARVNLQLADGALLPDPAGIERAALGSERIQSILAGRTPLKVIQAGGGKLVNIVVRDAEAG